MRFTLENAIRALPNAYFVNFFTNMKAMLTVGKDEQFDINDPADIEDIYNRINAAVESINFSVVLKAAK